jgi:hypothetical protein
MEFKALINDYLEDRIDVMDSDIDYIINNQDDTTAIGLTTSNITKKDDTLMSRNISSKNNFLETLGKNDLLSPEIEENNDINNKIFSENKPKWSILDLDFSRLSAIQPSKSVQNILAGR